MFVVVLCGILGLADMVLHFADNFLGFAFGLGLAIAGDLASGLLDGAFDFFAGAVDAIPIHAISPHGCSSSKERKSRPLSSAKTMANYNGQ